MCSVRFAGINFSGLRTSSLIELSDEIKFVATVNSEFIVKYHRDQKFKSIIDGCINTFDGQVPWIMAKIFCGGDFEKISGSDLIYKILDFAKINGKKIFFLGGKLDSNEISVRMAREKYGVDVCGYSPPLMEFPFSEEHNEAILKKISEFSPAYLFVGFGAGKQEFWINQNIDRLRSSGVRFVIGTGGTFEFFSGRIKRAPFWIQKIGLEGIYRFFQEPSLMRLSRLFYSLNVFFYALTK